MATKSKTTTEDDTKDVFSDDLKGFAAFTDANGPAMEVFQKSVDRAVEVNKENVEAMVESLTAATKALEVLSGESLSFSKQVFEEGVKVSKAMMAVKSPQEFMTLHSDYTRSVFDQLVNQTTKVNDLGMTGLKNTFAPINKRVGTLSKAAQKAGAF